MSIAAHFIDKVEFCPHCGSHSFEPQIGWKAKAGSWAINKAIDTACKKMSGGWLKPSYFVEVTNPEDFTNEFACDDCYKKFTRADCLYIDYMEDEYKPGDDIEELVTDIFEHSTGIYVTDMSERICKMTNYMGRVNFECNLILALGMKNEIVSLMEISEYLNVDEDDLTLDDVVKFYQAHIKELDEYANMSILEKMGMQENIDEIKKISKHVTSSDEFQNVVSSAKGIMSDLGIKKDDIGKAKSLFKSFFD